MPTVVVVVAMYNMVMLMQKAETVVPALAVMDLLESAHQKVINTAMTVQLTQVVVVAELIIMLQQVPPLAEQVQAVLDVCMFAITPTILQVQ